MLVGHRTPPDRSRWSEGRALVLRWSTIVVPGDCAYIRLTMADTLVLEFMQKAEKDPELGARVRGVRVDDKNQALAALARIAKEAGYELSPGDLETGLRGRSPGELSDDKLDGVSAGGTAAGWAPVETSAFRSFFIAGF